MPSEAQHKAQVDSSKSFPFIGLLSMILPHRCHATTADQRPRASIWWQWPTWPRLRRSLDDDGSFIKGILHSPTERAMVESINQIAHVMGRQTIVEFVEDEAVLACLRAMGVDFAQGYGVGRPQPLQAAQVVDVE